MFRKFLPAILVATFLLTACPSGEKPMDMAIVVVGPGTIKKGSSAQYVVVIGAVNKPPALDFNPFTMPLYLQESDGTLMTFFQGVHLPPGVNSQTIQMSLSCNAAGNLGGNATSLPGGLQNNPVSGAGTTRPGLVAANFGGKRFDSRYPNPTGNETSVRCVP